MNPITCIIVDDEPLAVKLLESFVAKTPDLELIGSFTDSVEAINAIKEQKPDLLFLTSRCLISTAWNWHT